MRAFGVTEAEAYWRRVPAANPVPVKGPSEAQLLDPVCHPGWPVWFNTYVARSQRRAFLDALPHCGDVRDRDVLEVGCGTGRWTILLRDLGAHVRAVDLSPEAIDADRRRISGVDFECADLLALPLGDECVDLAVSVTVIQHVPYEAQARAVSELARVLRRGGHPLLLENTKDRDRHVFARSPRDWKALLAAHGFRCLYAHDYSYDLPLRAGRAIWALRTVGRRAAGKASSLEGEPLPRSALAVLASRPFVVSSQLVEPFSWRLLPAEVATHCAFVFKRVT